MVSVTPRSEVVEALKELGGKATSRELLEKLIEKGMDAVQARLAISEAVRNGLIKKVPDYEGKVELFTLGQ